MVPLINTRLINNTFICVEKTCAHPFAPSPMITAVELIRLHLILRHDRVLPTQGTRVWSRMDCTSQRRCRLLGSTKDGQGSTSSVPDRGNLL